MRLRAKLLLLGSAAALAAAIPALSQETVLPPGFGDPEQQPPVPPEDAPVTEPAEPTGNEACAAPAVPDESRPMAPASPQGNGAPSTLALHESPAAA
jgi:hypothetical protein